MDINSRFSHSSNLVSDASAIDVNNKSRVSQLLKEEKSINKDRASWNNTQLSHMVDVFQIMLKINETTKKEEQKNLFKRPPLRPVSWHSNNPNKKNEKDLQSLINLNNLYQALEKIPNAKPILFPEDKHSLRKSLLEESVYEFLKEKVPAFFKDSFPTTKQKLTSTSKHAFEKWKKDFRAQPYLFTQTLTRLGNLKITLEKWVVEKNTHTDWIKEFIQRLDKLIQPETSLESYKNFLKEYEDMADLQMQDIIIAILGGEEDLKKLENWKENASILTLQMLCNEWSAQMIKRYYKIEIDENSNNIHTISVSNILRTLVPPTSQGNHTYNPLIIKKMQISISKALIAIDVPSEKGKSEDTIAKIISACQKCEWIDEDTRRPEDQAKVLIKEESIAIVKLLRTLSISAFAWSSNNNGIHYHPELYLKKKYWTQISGSQSGGTGYSAEVQIFSSNYFKTVIRWIENVYIYSKNATQYLSDEETKILPNDLSGKGFKVADIYKTYSIACHHQPNSIDKARYGIDINIENLKFSSHTPIAIQEDLIAILSNRCQFPKEDEENKYATVKESKKERRRPTIFDSQLLTTELKDEKS